MKKKAVFSVSLFEPRADVFSGTSSKERVRSAPDVGEKLLPGILKSAKKKRKAGPGFYHRGHNVLTKRSKKN